MLLILIYLLTIRRNAVVSDRFMNTAEAMIRKRDYLGLIAYSHRRNECMARITQKTLDFITANPDGLRLKTSAKSPRPRAPAKPGMLTSRITYLADIGAIAPMVGLLGTVLGMIKAFLEISSGDSPGRAPNGLAEGVSEALIATAGGLVIGIPALAFYSIFRGRVQKYIAELEAAATHSDGPAPRAGRAPAAVTAVLRTRRSAPREDYAMPVPSPLGGERPDLHGI